MLVYRGEKKSWQHPKKGKNLDFRGLIQLLEKETEKIAAKDKWNNVPLPARPA